MHFALRPNIDGAGAGGRLAIWAKLALALSLAALLGACSGSSKPVSASSPHARPPVRPPVSMGVARGFGTAAAMGVSMAPHIARLGLEQADARGVLRAFIESCTSIRRRTDKSGLTVPEDWQTPCDEAPRYSGDPRNFFVDYFEAIKVGSGEAFATGYFEPQIHGSREWRPGYNVPVFAKPYDLEQDRQGNSRYYTRAEIEAGALEGKADIIAWAADPVEFFFLQIQGSGQLISPEGEVIRIGYAGQNGHPYTGIGQVMRDRGLLGNGPGKYSGSMQGIMQYVREHPEDGYALMQMNESYIFFRELTSEGPVGAIGVTVRGGDSVAVDPNYVPYGAPILLDVEQDAADGLWIAQDTGGAIKGANRFDTFWGSGANARRIAGGMSAKGTALIFLPKPAVRRLRGQGQGR